MCNSGVRRDEGEQAGHDVRSGIMESSTIPQTHLRFTSTSTSESWTSKTVASIKERPRRMRVLEVSTERRTSRAPTIVSVLVYNHLHQYTWSSFSSASVIRASSGLRSMRTGTSNTPVSRGCRERISVPWLMS